MFYLIGTILFLISRVWFLNWGEVLFDSGEYIARWSNPEFLSALISGHPPLHSGYVLYNWLAHRLLANLGLDPLPGILVIQVILALGSVFFFGKVVERLTDQGISKRAMVIISLIPIFWIVNTTVTMETTYLFFFFGSLFFLSKYLTDKSRLVYLILSMLFFILAFLTHTVVLIWIPMCLYLAWTWGRKNFLKIVLSGLVSLSVASAINAYLLSISLKTSLVGGLYWLYAAKFGEHAWFSLSLETLARYMRNWIVPLAYNNTTPLIIIGALALIRLWRTKRSLLWISVLWIAPSLIANQWWDSLLYGRHALIASFGLAFLAATMLKGVGFRLISCLILVISLPALQWLSEPIPYKLMEAKLHTLPGGGLLIDSHFARPYTEGDYFGETVYVDEPGWDIDKTDTLIEEYINRHKDVFVTGHALSEPYGLFSGPYLHPLSLSYQKPFVLEQLIAKWGFAEYEEVNRDLNLMIYRIFPQSNKYATINRLDESVRRIDYYDPVRLFMSALRGGLNLYP